MSSFTRAIARSGPFTRSVATAALMGATMLVTPQTVARAGTVSDAAIQLAQAGGSQNLITNEAALTRGETVERRITALHKVLKISADEETKWDAVAKAMRENAANMDTLIAEIRKTPRESMTALDDLKNYQKVTQAHVDGLKNLIASFEALYAAMPDDQKKVADHVFRATEH